MSGQENKVAENLRRRIKTEEMSDVIYEVLIPTERVSEIKRGKKTETTRKFFPGLSHHQHEFDRRAEKAG